jgi:dTDP-4-dehydrorhamnose 3,5-epimerase
MKFKELSIPGVFVVSNFVSKDERGVFVKTYNSNQFGEIGFMNDFKESYYSTSFKDVIRGMHFQIPPYEHEKLVYVVEGKILDVVLDLRKDSPTFKSCVSFELESMKNSILIPKGCAHGFLTLTQTATIVYSVTTVYQKEADNGIKWDSFGFDWNINQAIISQRDNEFIPLDMFKSPFDL